MSIAGGLISRLRCRLSEDASRWRWRGMLVATGLCAVVILLSLPKRYTSSAWTMRVMTFNIAGRKADEQRLLALLHQQQPDLVLLQEVRHSRKLRGIARHLQLPYWRFAPYRHRFGAGIGILSRWPLGPAHVLAFQEGVQGRVALAAAVDTPEGGVWACSVHLESPRENEFGSTVWTQGVFLWRELFAATPRYRQAVTLRSWLDQFSNGACIVGGDFNTIPFSRVDRYLSRYFDDVLRHRPWRYLTGTYWNLPVLPVNPRIDFLYHSPDLRVIDARVIRQKVSDHFPILSILSLLRRSEEQGPTLPVEKRMATSGQTASRMTSPVPGRSSAPHMPH